MPGMMPAAGYPFWKKPGPGLLVRALRAIVQFVAGRK